MIIFSNAFLNKETIPTRHTYEGRNISPHLAWRDVPKSCRSMVLLIEDPDAPDPKSPSMTWVHWILYNLSPQITEIPEGIASSRLPEGALQGMNDWKHVEYGGPCPPFGEHRYVHRLIALDILLPDLKFPGRVELERAMRGHIVAQASLIGLYGKTIHQNVEDCIFLRAKLTWENYGHKRY